MKKNECAQEMILDLVMRHGCEVKLRPHVNPHMNAIEIVISHEGYHSGVAIDLTKQPYTSIPLEEIACRSIERAAMDLFRHPYKQMLEKHFHKED